MSRGEGAESAGVQVAAVSPQGGVPTTAGAEGEAGTDTMWAVIMEDAGVDSGGKIFTCPAVQKVIRHKDQSTNGLYLDSQFSPSTASQVGSSGATKNAIW